MTDDICESKLGDVYKALHKSYKQVSEKDFKDRTLKLSMSVMYAVRVFHASFLSFFVYPFDTEIRMILIWVTRVRQTILRCRRPAPSAR